MQHIFSVKCGCSFCWLCMEEIEDKEIPYHYQDPTSKCHGKQMEGTDMGGPPLCVKLFVGCLMVIFIIPCTVLALIGCLCAYPCACCAMFVVEGEAPSVIRFFGGCALGCTMIPVGLICLFVLAIWMYITALYGILKDTICPCLPRCPRCCMAPQPDDVM